MTLLPFSSSSCTQRCSSRTSAAEDREELSVCLTMRSGSPRGCPLPSLWAPLASVCWPSFIPAKGDRLAVGTHSPAGRPSGCCPGAMTSSSGPAPFPQCGLERGLTRTVMLLHRSGPEGERLKKSGDAPLLRRGGRGGEWLKKAQRVWNVETSRLSGRRVNTSRSCENPRGQAS